MKLNMFYKTKIAPAILPVILAALGIALIYIVGSGKYTQPIAKLIHKQSFTEADKTTSCTLPADAFTADATKNPQLFVSCSGFLE